jgi:glutamate dehydrogenase (NAD(P)+)
MNFYWQKEEVLARLDRALTEAFVTVSEMARTRKVTLRDAAHVIAVSRVAAACRGRGWV